MQASRKGPGYQPENNVGVREPKVRYQDDGNRRFEDKPVLTPSPFERKIIVGRLSLQVQFELVSELNHWNHATKAMLPRCKFTETIARGTLCVASRRLSTVLNDSFYYSIIAGSADVQNLNYRVMLVS